MTNMITCSSPSDNPVVDICSSEKSFEDANSSSLSFGTLSVLPRELRLQIWEDVLYGTSASSPQMPPKERGICSYLSSCLLLNKPVHREITSEQYYTNRKLYLCFLQNGLTKLTIMWKYGSRVRSSEGAHTCTIATMLVAHSQKLPIEN